MWAYLQSYVSAPQNIIGLYLILLECVGIDSDEVADYSALINAKSDCVRMYLRAE